VRAPQCSACGAGPWPAAGPLVGLPLSGARSSACLLLGLLALSGCGRYADFNLPPVSGGDPSMTFAFEAQVEPVLTGGEGWESHDVLNPSVISHPGPQSLLNLYSGFDGRTWRTGLARSDDGTHWQKQGVILSPDPRTWEGSYIAANGSALRYEKQFWYWYQAGPRERPRIGLARAVDTHSWRKEPKPVLEPGPYASWDEYGVADPCVVRIESYFYLFYLGQDRARRQRLGVARSTDGVRWEKLRANPVLELGDPGGFDENGPGRAGRLEFARFLLDALHRPRHHREPPSGPGALHRRRPLAQAPHRLRRRPAVGCEGGLRSHGGGGGWRHPRLVRRRRRRVAR